MTWNELKQVIENMPEKYLDKQVTFWDEEANPVILAYDTIKEDLYLDDIGSELTNVGEEMNLIVKEDYPYLYPAFYSNIEAVNYAKELVS